MGHCQGSLDNRDSRGSQDNPGSQGSQDKKDRQRTGESGTVGPASMSLDKRDMRHSWNNLDSYHKSNLDRKGTPGTWDKSQEDTKSLVCLWANSLGLTLEFVLDSVWGWWSGW